MVKLVNKDLPRRATLEVKDYELTEVEFDNGDKNKKLTLIGDIMETDHNDLKINNTTKTAMWVGPDAKKSDFGEVSTGTSAGKFIRQFGIKSEKEIVGLKVPIILQPSPTNPEQEFYVIDLR